jgi:hypothetical protein
MFAKTLCAVAALATLSVATPSFAGEGSPDLSNGYTGNRNYSRIYRPYVDEREFMVEPAAPYVVERRYEPDYNTGYIRREWRQERDDLD